MSKRSLEIQSMKPIVAALLILASVFTTIHFALGASTPDRPAGVDAGHWIPVSDKMGFVVTTPSIPGRRVTTDVQRLLLASPAEGYLMVPTLRQDVATGGSPRGESGPRA
jgi:hypothetical protein